MIKPLMYRHQRSPHQHRARLVCRSWPTFQLQLQHPLLSASCGLLLSGWQPGQQHRPGQSRSELRPRRCLRI
jgi:hypothetical protein